MTQQQSVPTTLNNSKPMIVNQETGEFMGPVGGDETLDPNEAIPMNAKFSKAVVAYVHETLADTPLPLHLAMLEGMGLSEGDMLTLIEAWDSAPQMTLKDFVAEFSGRDVLVRGVQIYEQGPYKAKGTGLTMPGYYQPRLLVVNPETKKRVTLRTSSPLISQIIFYTGRKHGFWFFDRPLTYQFKLDKEGRLQMARVEQTGEETLEQRLAKISRGVSGPKGATQQ